VDDAGNVYLAGQFTNTISFGGISVTNGGGFVAKYSSSGVIQWADQAAVQYGDVAMDGQTNVYATGLLNLNAAVAKYNPTGTLQWMYSASGPPASPYSSVAVKCAGDSAGHCYLVGWYQGTNTFGTNVLQPQGVWNFFLAKVAAPVIILSAPQVTVGKTNFTFLLSGPAGSNFVVQASTNLSNWSSVSTSTIPVGGSITLSNAISGYNRRFYRAYLQ
jgi:hypothetical protein